MEPHFAIYQSRALIEDCPESHNDILEVSQRNNRRDGLTGFLYREQDCFLQYLEGPKTPLFNTFARIGRDKRHTDFEVLKVGPARQKLLPDWQMGFVGQTDLCLRDLLEVCDGRFNITTHDPLDLVTFLIANAHAIRERHVPA